MHSCAVQKLTNWHIRLKSNNNYNLYFVHNTISTPYFHRQKNSTKKTYNKSYLHKL